MRLVFEQCPPVCFSGDSFENKLTQVDANKSYKLCVPPFEGYQLPLHAYVHTLVVGAYA